VTEAGDWAATCPFENSVKSDAANNKQIRFGFIRVTLLNLFELASSGFSNTSLGDEITP
jgi:hypothetical protein